MISITEDYVAMHEAVAETIWFYKRAEQINDETSSRNADWVQRTALEWYKEAAGDIQISDPTRIDLDEVGRAVRVAGNDISLLLSIGSRLTPKEKKERIDAIKASLKERPRAAARQLESFQSAGGSVS